MQITRELTHPPLMAITLRLREVCAEVEWVITLKTIRESLGMLILLHLLKLTLTEIKLGVLSSGKHCSM